MLAAPAPQAALGSAVKARRLELGLTQVELARQTNLHSRWISNLETGRRNPSYASLRRLADGLELAAAELIAHAEAAEAAEASRTAGRPEAVATSGVRR